MPSSTDRMKKAIAEAREANGEPPAPPHRCCTSGVPGRHTWTCPNHPSRHCRPGEDGGDVAEFLRQIQGHPKRKGK